MPPKAGKTGAGRTRGLVCQLSGISKSFGATKALDDVSLDVFEGEMLAVVGENGAGKSTLMNVLFGLVPPDMGEVRVGDARGPFKAASEAIACGVGMVHQHFMLFPGMTVLENILVGAEIDRGGGLIDFTKQRREIQELANRFDFKLPLDDMVGTLPVGARQQIEIVKMLYRGARIIILDEPTAVLTPQECQALFDMLRNLKEGGASVILVTHKLAEVIDNSDRVVVMRQGGLVHETETSKTSQSELSANMVGYQIERPEKRSFAKDRTVLSVQGLAVAGQGVAPALHDVSLDIRAGEILGVAGVSGSGQKEFVEAVVGTRRAESGDIVFNGESVRGWSVGQRRRAGLSYIAEDREHVGLAVAASVEENAIAGSESEPPLSGRVFLKARNIGEYAGRMIKQFDIRTTGPKQPVSDLSGGNKQKVVVGRELSREPELVVAQNPCWGVDVGAIGYIQKQLLDHAEKGAAVLLVSSDLEELFDLSDRLVVFYEGGVAAEFDRADLDLLNVGAAMSGGGG